MSLKTLHRWLLPGEVRSQRELVWSVLRLVVSIVVVADLVDASANLLFEPQRLFASFVQTTLIAASMGGLFGYVQYRSNLNLFRTKFQLEVLSRIDAQTGLLNRRSFLEASEAVLARGVPTMLIVADIDRFKSINDTLGHPVGDVVIAGVGQTLAAAFPEPHLTGRLGGEEFAVLFMTDDPAEALRAAEAFRQSVGAADFLSPPRRVSISAGLAAVRPGAPFAEAYAAADAALYCAKLKGRDAVVDAADADTARLAELRARAPQPAAPPLRQSAGA